MREMVFKMERTGLVEEGREVEVSEGTLPGCYYYTIEPAIAMSGNIPLDQRLSENKGVVKKIEKSESGYYVTVSFGDQ